MFSLREEFITVFLAGLPFIELRASIPIGIKLGMTPFSAFAWSVIGNSIPAVVILLLIRPLTEWAHHNWKWLDHVLQVMYEKVQKHLKGRETLEGVALALFVGVPFPGTGAWTGAVLAFLLGLPFKKSFPAIFLGIVIAGLIVTLVATGVFASLDFLVI
jgi:uncharacterized membrane protein